MTSDELNALCIDASWVPTMHLRYYKDYHHFVINGNEMREERITLQQLWTNQVDKNEKWREIEVVSE